MSLLDYIVKGIATLFGLFLILFMAFGFAAGVSLGQTSLKQQVLEIEKYMLFMLGAAFLFNIFKYMFSYLPPKMWHILLVCIYYALWDSFWRVVEWNVILLLLFLLAIRAWKYLASRDSFNEN